MLLACSMSPQRYPGAPRSEVWALGWAGREERRWADRLVDTRNEELATAGPGARLLLYSSLSLQPRQFSLSPSKPIVLLPDGKGYCQIKQLHVDA